MRIRVSVASLVAVTLAGCSSAVGGQPTATPGTGTEKWPPPSASVSGGPSPSKDQTYGAPRVSDPLDATRYLSRPCAALTTAQLTTFGVTEPGKPDTDSEIAKRAGPACVWHTDRELELDSTVGIGFLTGNKHGLSDTYRGRSRFKLFEETMVDGYPAVFNELSDSRASGNCNITVGISDTLTFRAGEQGRLKGQASCDRAKQVAAAVIATLRSA